MADDGDTVAALADDEFERLGRQAGAELRTPPPADGPRVVQRTANRRRATSATVAAGTAVAIVVTGLFVANRNPKRELDDQPVATTPPPSAPVVATTEAKDPQDTSLPIVVDATTPVSVVATTETTDLQNTSLPIVVDATTPGTWRLASDSPVAQIGPVSAVWTGKEAILLGRSDADTPTLSAVAYDVGRDQWRRLADPPLALTIESLPWVEGVRWTGSEVLTSTNQAEVFAYDPVEDRWEARAPADESMSLATADYGVAVSARGVLAQSSEGWWWYENSTDRWEALPAPALGVDYTMVAALDHDTMVATQIDGQTITDGRTITSAVLDIDTRTWRDGPPIVGPPGNAVTSCEAVDGLLVCFVDQFGLDGVVIDPLVGSLDTFTLGNHGFSSATRGIPWMAHAWKLFSPRSATWEDLPPLGDVDGFNAAVWTGSEIVFFGGTNSQGGELGTTAAYTPLHLPDL